MRNRIGVDLDDTLCKGQHWDTPEQVLGAKPIKEMIEAVEKLYKDNFVIIYTARQNFLISATMEWLDKHNVKYHAISNKKIPLGKLIDDLAISPQEFLKGQNE